MDKRHDPLSQHWPSSRPLTPRCPKTASSQEPKFLSHHEYTLPQGLRWHLTSHSTTIREARHSPGSALQNSRGSLLQRLHDTESMAEWLMVAYHEKGRARLLSAMRFMSVYGTADRASMNAASTHPLFRTLPKVGVGLCRTFQTNRNSNREY